MMTQQSLQGQPGNGSMTGSSGESCTVMRCVEMSMQEKQSEKELTGERDNLRQKCGTAGVVVAFAWIW